MLAVVLYEGDQHFALLHKVSELGVDFFDGPGLRGLDDVLHLHGDHHDQRIAGLDRGALLDCHLLNNSRHGRDSVAQTSSTRTGALELRERPDELQTAVLGVQSHAVLGDDNSLLGNVSIYICHQLSEVSLRIVTEPSIHGVTPETL